MRRNRQPDAPSASVAAVTAAVVGLLLFAYGVTAFVFGGGDFDTAPTGGTVTGETWLGIEGNGWTNLLVLASGTVLIAASPADASARLMSAVVGLVLGAAAVAAVIDGDDVLGTLAANSWTIVAWAATAVVLIALAARPRAGRRHDEQTVAGPPREPVQRESQERDRLGPRGRVH